MKRDAPGSERLSLAGHTILVVDDTEAVRTAFEVLLSVYGARVVSAASRVRRSSCSRAAGCTSSSRT